MTVNSGLVYEGRGYFPVPLAPLIPGAFSPPSEVNTVKSCDPHWASVLLLLAVCALFVLYPSEINSGLKGLAAAADFASYLIG